MRSQLRNLPPGNWKVTALLVAAGALFAAGTLTLALWRYVTYRTAWPFDLAFFNHQLWNLWHGMAPLTLRPVNYYAIEGPEPWRMAQMRLLTVPLAPAYAIRPGVSTLLAMQSVVCGFGVWPMYRIAARRSGRPFFGLLAAGAYVLCAPLWLIATTEFRPITLAVPFVLMAIDALDARATGRYAVWSVLALCSRHVVAVVLAAATVAMAFRRGESRSAKLRWIAGPMALSLAWMGLFCLFVWSMHGGEAVRAYLRGLRNPETVGSRLEHPIRTTLSEEWHAAVKYQLPLVVAGLGAPELTAVGMALNVPPLRMGQWSLRPSQHFVRYTAPSTMLLLAAVAITLGRIGRGRFSERGKGNAPSLPRSLAPSPPPSPPRARGGLRGGVAILVCAMAMALSTAGVITESLRLPSRLSQNDRELLDRTLHKIESQEAVLAYFDILPQLSSRSRLYAYEQLPGFGPNEPFSLRAFDRALDQVDWCIVRTQHPALIHRVLVSGRFEQVAAGERLQVFRRVASWRVGEKASS